MTAFIVIWLIYWLYLFPNIYGWLTDDAMTFARIATYERGGENLLDIQWFHAYMWFLVTIPWLFHWSIPSYTIPRSWEATGHFRALILITIVLHAALLGIMAAFLRQLSKNAWVCFGAFVLIITSPTFNFYADLLDSRYLGLIAGIPAIMILLSRFAVVDQPLSKRAVVIGFFLPGFLFGVGQAVHYTEWYLNGPISAVYWLLALRPDWRARNVWLHLGVYVAGIFAWFVPVQWLSLQYHSFGDSMLGTMIFQVDNHLSPYGRVADIGIWISIFWDEMGLPMMLAAAAGALVVAMDRWRPSYVTRTNSAIMLWSTVIASAYFLWTPAYPFYRQVSGLQIFYGLFAMVAVERCTVFLGNRKLLRIGAAVALFFTIAFVPSFLRTPETFRAQQGLGLAVNLAHRVTSDDHIYFMATYDWDPHKHALLSRTDFDKLRDDDYLVTDYPIFYHVKYPDIFALIHETRPVGSFPTLFCTQEMWAELRAYFGFREWWTEPENCDASVYRVGDIRANDGPATLPISRVTADSSLTPSQGPLRAVFEHDPAGPVDDNVFAAGVFADLWASKPRAGAHWLKVTFSRPSLLRGVTIVPADWYAPPDFKTVGRIASLQIYGKIKDRSALLWSADNLTHSAVFTARFKAQELNEVLFVVTPAGQPKNIVAAIENIHFLGYRSIGAVHR